MQPASQSVGNQWTAVNLKPIGREGFQQEARQCLDVFIRPIRLPELDDIDAAVNQCGRPFEYRNKQVVDIGDGDQEWPTIGADWQARHRPPPGSRGPLTQGRATG